MFKFLTQLGVVAKEQGYKLSKIDIKIPSVKFAPVQLFMFSIPLPMIELRGRFLKAHRCVC
jgi:hypothetical protein